jgi:Glyoxalase-like domain
MARIQDVVFDSRHPASIARFWAAALDGYDVAPYDQAELDRLKSQGFAGPEEDPSVLVEAPGTLPRLFFQLVPETKVVKNRVHIDLRSDDPDREADRLCDLGASRVAEHERFITLLDPEGNEFCIMR